MDSFAQQMLNEIDRRYKALQLNSSIDNENEHFLEIQETAHSDSNEVSNKRNKISYFC